MFIGLGALVDILSGVMAGANYSSKVRKWTHAGADSAADLGQVFIAVDPNCFAPGFEDRMTDFNGRLRGCKAVSVKFKQTIRLHFNHLFCLIFIYTD